MAKHINSVTVDGQIIDTKTSTHRSYVAVSAIRDSEGTVGVLSWHLTAEAAHKYLRSSTVDRIIGTDSEGIERIVLPVEVEIKYSRKELAEGISNGSPIPAVEAPVEIVEEAAEVETIHGQDVLAGSDEDEVAEALAALAAEEAPAPKAKTVRKPKSAPVEAVDLPAEDWKIEAMADFVEGELVVGKDGREFTVVGPGERGPRTIKLSQDRDGKAWFTYRFARNIAHKA